VFSVGATLGQLPQIFDKGERFIPDNLEHCLGIIDIFEAGPTDMLLAGGKGGIFEVFA
jgi:hypothetical protein